MIVNIRDRSSIEAAYPLDVFAQDARNNSDPKATILHGISILSDVDADGELTLERATRHVGEASGTPDEAPFLAPFLLVAAADVAQSGDPARPKRRDPDEAHGHRDYGDFIDRLIAAARTVRFRRQPAPDDERLRGPRQ